MQQQAIKSAVKDTFNTPSGRIVLAHLIRFAGIFDATPKFDLAYAAGMRNVVCMILNMLYDNKKQEPDEVIKQMEELINGF